MKYQNPQPTEISAKRSKRAASVPSELLPIVRASIPGEVRVRSVAQTAKANNATGILCLELFTKYRISDHEQRLRELEAIVYRRAA